MSGQNLTEFTFWHFYMGMEVIYLTQRVIFLVRVITYLKLTSNNWFSSDVPLTLLCRRTVIWRQWPDSVVKWFDVAPQTRSLPPSPHHTTDTQWRAARTWSRTALPMDTQLVQGHTRTGLRETALPSVTCAVSIRSWNIGVYWDLFKFNSCVIFLYHIL